MHAKRTRFGRDIVTEFMPPRRRSRRAVILCDGLPTVPAKTAVLDHFSRLGFWVFHPRYRGTWESGGRFLAREPHLDILDVVGGIRTSFCDVWEGERFAPELDSIHVIGSSFGGTAALLCAADDRVRSVVAFSPVVDWTVESKDEPFAYLQRVVQKGYGDAYRGSAAHWRRLKAGGFFDPITRADGLDGEKILLIHTKDDTVVPKGPAERFAKRTGCDFALYARGGHLSTSAVMRWPFALRIERFLEGNGRRPV